MGTTRPIVVTGSTGQVGGDLVRLLKLAGRDVHSLDRAQADLSQPLSIVAALEKIQPSLVLNPGAYTAVDLAEKEQDLAFRVNAETPGAMAEWCAKHDVPFVSYSTDYVFAGGGTRPWSETDPTGPLSVYGKSKLAGEQSIQKAGGRFLILRTSWVYAPQGKNFLNTMLRLGAEREELRVVSDQIGAPTYSSHLAQATLDMLDGALEFDAFPSGIYHVCNSGETNWNEFAREIFAEARKRGAALKVRDVHGIKTSEYPTPAPRPLNSRLSTLKLLDTFGIKLPSWREGLTECLRAKL